MSTAHDLINDFEEEQRVLVFTSLSAYLAEAQFTDVALVCRGNGGRVHQLKAHKIVLASSSKFFRDIFCRNPLIQVIDLDQELAPNMLVLSFADVQLIIGVLYCVGTVEISPQRVASLHLAAQILGIPTLIRFLKKIRDSLVVNRDFSGGEPHFTNYSPYQTVADPLVGASRFEYEVANGRDTDCPDNLFQIRNNVAVKKRESAAPQCPRSPRLEEDIDDESTGRPSRSQSLASFDSFSLQQLPSPISRDAGGHGGSGGGGSSSIRVVSSVLESFDPSAFLNHLPANQIVDLENALLPHLQSEEPQSKSSQRIDDIDADDPNSKRSAEFVKDSENRSQCEPPKKSSYATGCVASTTGPPLGFCKLLPSGNQNLKADPVILRPCLSPQPVRLQTASDEIPLKTSAEVSSKQSEAIGSSSQITREHDSSDREDIEETAHDEADLVIDEAERSRSQLSNCSNGAQEHDTSGSEISVNLERVDKGKSFKFAIPGSSKSVTLNFSADALLEMRNSVTMEKESSSEKEDMMEQEISSSTADTVDDDGQLEPVKNDEPKTARNDRRKRKQKSRPERPSAVLECHLCEKTFVSKQALDKHLPYHVEVITTCKICGKLFFKKWALEQHMAVDHKSEENLKCNDCGKVFKWSRNLLAHTKLCHVEEKRYRCKFCPLTFLKRKSYVNHQRRKHSQRPDTFCKLCLEIFDSAKLREDHVCALFENTGHSVICHRHKEPKEFFHQADVEEHLKSHADENLVSGHKQSCPVCHKKFLMKKNLNTHMRRFHELEGAKTEHGCKFCGKTFYYKADCEEHENTHADEKPFSCHCGRGYSSKKALLNHQKLAHEGRNDAYKCSICKKLLSTKYKLKLHMSVHSEHRNFQCSQCGVMFKARENLAKHMGKQHSKLKGDERSSKLPQSDSGNTRTTSSPSSSPVDATVAAEAEAAAAQAAVRDDNVEHEEIVVNVAEGPVEICVTEL